MDETWHPASRWCGADVRPKRTYRYTWMPDNWLATAESTGQGLWGTQVVTVACPDEFLAVRLVLANVCREPYDVALIKVSPSAGWGDYVNPSGRGEWYTLTSANGGADSGEIVWHKSERTSHAIPGNTNANADTPELYFTDWCPVPCEVADAATKMRVLMIRLLMKKGGKVTFTHGGFVNYTASRWTHGYDYFVGGESDGVDHVTVPDRMDRGTSTHANLVGGSLVLAVQFITKHPGIQGMNTGDSHHSGGGTEAVFNSYMMRLNGWLGAAHAGGIPFGFATAAHGGSTTVQYMAWLKAYLPFVQPTYCILPGWSFNDHEPGTDPRHVISDVFLPRLRAAAEHVVKHDAVPIFLTPFPQGRMTIASDLLMAWRRLREQILALRGSGALVVDATLVLGNQRGGTFDGTFLPGASSDSAHPNDAGHAAVAKALVPVVAALCGLPPILDLTSLS